MKSSFARVRGSNPQFVKLIAIAFMLTAVGGHADRFDSGSSSDDSDRAPAETDDPPPASSPRLEPSDFRLVGGWRLAQEYPRGALAIDFDNQRVFIGGHAQRQEIVEFSLMRQSDERGSSRRGNSALPPTGPRNTSTAGPP